MGSASESEEEVDAKTILAIRTSAKRRHTRQANHLKTLVDGGGTADDVNVALAVLEEAYSEVVRVNAKYKQADKGKEKDAIEWEAEINTFYMGCRKAAEEYSNKEKEKLDAAPNAKKRRLELEFEREQAKLVEQRKLEDIRQQSQREQEDLTLQIEYQRQLEGLKSPGKSSFKPRFTSSINDSDDEKRPRGPWPKLSITPFNGDSRTWPDFELSFGALINNTRMPEDMKLLALRENLEPDVRRRVANLFVASANYQTSWKALTDRYGNRQAIMHAHVQELLALQPFSSGDLKSLVNMAALVKDAVTSVNQEEGQSYSNIVSQLIRVLPSELQREWGRFAYPLRPRVPGLADFDKWIEGIVGAEEFLGASASRTTQKSPQPPAKMVKFGPTVRMATIQNPTNEDNTCTVRHANPGHPLAFCQTFIDFSPTQRAEAVAKGKHCFRCLGRKHFSSACKKSTKCTVTDCSQFHHPLLHGSGRVFPRRSGNAVALIERLYINFPVLVAIVPIWVIVHNGAFRTLGMLDPGSEITLMRKDFAENIGVSGHPDALHLGSCLDSQLIQTQLIKFDISSIDKRNKFHVEEAIVVPSIKGSDRRINWPKEKLRWDHLADLDLPEIDSGKVDVLIGQDVEDAHRQLATRKSPNRKEPTGKLTPFGWTVIGRIPASILKGPSKKNLSCHSTGVENPSDADLVTVVQNFYATETFGTSTAPLKMSVEDTMAFEMLASSIRNVGSRFELGLPWKIPRKELPNNRTGALQRFMSVEKRLLKDPKIAERYVTAIEKYVFDGHARLLATSELGGAKGRVWYLPHHYVINPNKPNKIRVVFDGAAKFQDTSLNDHLLRGPVLLASLVGILIRSREAPVAVAGDIEAMYNQVRVHPDDQSAQRFLWRRPGSGEEPKVFQMLVQVFGLVSSPTSCLYALQYAAEAYEKYPEVTDIVKTSFYVDNFIDSFETEDGAIETVKRITETLKAGGFRLNQWVSSSRLVLASIPESERVHSSLNLHLDELPVERSLGMMWNCQLDRFQFTTLQPVAVKTKREMLAAIAKIFDPLGFLLPVTTYAKVLFQKVWKTTQPSRTSLPKEEPLKWDDQLPEHIIHSWEKWRAELPFVGDLTVPRCFRDHRFQKEKTNFDLHVCCDASAVAFGAVCYIRMESGTEIDVKFVFAKSRVAPIKGLSIPRLELQAAVLASRIASMARKELRLPIRSVRFWSDSEIVLKWLASENRRYSSFVHHRVNEVTESSSSDDWSFIGGLDNPADDCSRGLRPTQLYNHHRWFEGPPFLKEPMENWPQYHDRQEPKTEDLELIKEKFVGSTEVTPTDEISDLFSTKSSLADLIDAVVNITRRISPTTDTNAPVAVEEKKGALKIAIKKAQELCFAPEVKSLQAGRLLKRTSNLLKLTPFLDGDGIVRVGGRIENAYEPYNARHPIVLDPDHRLTTWLIMEAHSGTAHAGVERTLAEVRTAYWPLKGRRAIRRVVKKCIQCKMQRARPAPPMMAKLPKPRVEPFQPAFTNIGLDFFGPFTVVIGRRREKRWACLFTCLATRAVHLEMVYRMDADSFIMAFIRFSRSRGITPATAYSDNGTNITAGEKELRTAFDNLISDPSLPKKLAEKRTQWHFSPPAAPHFGGVWERLVQESKRAIKAVLNERTVSDEVLVTVFVEVTALLNGRPLTNVSTDPTDANPLTPNHFLHQPHQYVPPDDHSTFEDNARRRWRYAQFIVEQYWKRWMREYVPTLIERKKWFMPNRNAEVGDRVLVIDENTRRGEWPVGTVVKVYPDGEGIVRHVTVKTESNEYKRPVTKLCLISEGSKDA